MRPGHDERITHLFRRGYSLDLVSELGCLYGWTRAEAKAVLATNGWSLDFSGRLQPQHMKGDMPVGTTAAHAGPERLLNAGIDHESAVIRRAALAAEKSLERLRATLMDQEATDAVAAHFSRLSTALGVDLGSQTPESDVRAS